MTFTSSDKYGLGMNEWFTKNNPFSQQAMAAIMLDAIRRGDWKTDMSVVRDLANVMARNVIANGMACCDCTCANLANLKWATQYLNADMLAQFNAQVYQSTGNPSFAPSQTPSQPQSSPQGNSDGSDVHATSESSGASGEVGEQSQDESYSPGEEGEGKAYEVSQQSSSASSESGLPIAAVVSVILLVCLVGVGYFRGNNKAK